ncbi:MAG: glycosyltransferase 87 family protein [Propionibacteriaceae bacterium]|nr:glycosyltransferase 87 family protein [Propionibacteriaceae bacterium]
MTTAASSPTSPSRRLGWGIILIGTFLATRVLNIWFWRTPGADFVQNDVSYYGYWLWCLLGDGAGQQRCADALAGAGVMTEYPLPAVWFLELVYTLGSPLPVWLPWVLLALAVAAVACHALLRAMRRPRAACCSTVLLLLIALGVWFIAALPLRPGAFNTWLPLFALTMLLLDGVVAVLLHRHGSPRGALFWILYIGACGPIVWFRFDILTAAAVALACLWLTRHPSVSGALVGLGAAVKLWPALLIFPMASSDPQRPGAARSRVVGFLALGGLLGLASLILGGWARSVSPITWQSNRGLQIESVPATPIHIFRAWTSETSWSLELSQYNAIELFGPATEHLLRVSSLLTLASILLTGLLTWRLFRNVPSETSRHPQAVLLSVLAIVLATIVANKTLSPQYIQWLAGPLAALLALPVRGWLRRPLFAMSALLFGVAILTHLTYPWAAQGIMALPSPGGLEVASLVGRNLLLMLICGLACGLAWRATAPSSKFR